MDTFSLGSGVALASMCVSPGAKNLLRAAGFRNLRDVLQAKPVDVARDLNLEPKKALEYLDEIRTCLGLVENRQENHFLNQNAIQMQSALELWEHSKTDNCHIVTFCQPLDDILGGGVPIGELTEFCGGPGAGKTQLCTQLAVDVTIPLAFGGVGGEAIYVDTEGSFTIERATDVAAALLRHLESITQRTAKHDSVMAETQRAALKDISTVDEILSKIHYCRAHDFAEQLACVRSIPDFLALHPRISLVIIDSIAFHFRHGFDDMAQRTRALNAHAQALNSLASHHKLGVVVTNQMTTKIWGSGGATDTTAMAYGGGGAIAMLGEATSHLVPALGESWSHAITNRVVLSLTLQHCDCLRYLPPSSEKERNKRLAYEDVVIRVARLIKSPSRMQESANFVILEQGVRKVPRARATTDTR